MNSYKYGCVELGCSWDGPQPMRASGPGVKGRGLPLSPRGRFLPHPRGDGVILHRIWRSRSTGCFIKALKPRIKVGNTPPDCSSTAYAGCPAFPGFPAFPGCSLTAQAGCLLEKRCGGVSGCQGPSRV
eukprot:259350-Chlamydomonas_euryale.AAC.1